MASRARKLSKSVHSPAQQAFRRLMIMARRRAKLTQQQLAKRLGKPQSFVAKYEGGERRLDVTEFLSVMRAIGGDPARLIKALMREMA
jgi:transcriptional regulator with XRE-family HTH domain